MWPFGLCIRIGVVHYVWVMICMMWDCIVGDVLAKKFGKNGRLDSRLGLKSVKSRASKLTGPHVSDV